MFPSPLPVCAKGILDKSNSNKNTANTREKLGKGVHCVMENSLTAAMLSWITGTQLLGSCNLGHVWQAGGNSKRETGGLGA